MDRNKFKSDVIAPSPKKRRELALEQLPDAPFVSPTILCLLWQLAEFSFILLSGFFLVLVYPGQQEVNNIWVYGSLMLTVSSLFCVFSILNNQYQLLTVLEPSRGVAGLLSSWFLAFAYAIAAVFFLKSGSDISRIWLVTWATAGLFFLLALRFFMGALMQHMNDKHQFDRRVILVGGGPSADEVIATLSASPSSGIAVVGLFDDRDDARSAIKHPTIKHLGSVDDLLSFARATRVDTLIVTLPVTAESRIFEVLEKLWVLPIDIRLSAHAQKVRYRPKAYSYVGNLPCIDLYDRPLGQWGWLTKSVSDFIIATIAIVVLSPLMLGVALAVKLTSKGPAIFKQKRYGFNNELIEVYKFRSMFVEDGDANASKLVTKGDKRVTPVGRFIRKSSLDELPQLINVLKGDLSLVGPRPHATMAKAAGFPYEQVVNGYFARHKVKPGITGWAQINGWRGETDTEEKIRRRVEHDLHYIENWSLTFDLYILARTPLSLLKTENAY